MPIYEYKCTNEICSRLYGYTRKEPFSPATSRKMQCVECESPLERKFTFQMNFNGAASAKKFPQEITVSLPGGIVFTGTKELEDRIEIILDGREKKIPRALYRGDYYYPEDMN